MLVRRADLTSEAARLRELRLRALAADPSAFGARHEEEAALPLDAWQARQAGATWWVAEEGGRWLGLLAGRVHDDGARELVSLWVAPEARGRRVGDALLDAGAAWARAAGATRVHLWSNAANAPALRLYERAGFAPTGPPVPGTRDPSRMLQRMEKALG
jgi:GNAT superfamily N-acetyltransferase